MKTITDLIPQYLSELSNKDSNSERYKWEAIGHFQENWDGDCSDEDFFEMFKKAFAKRENLIFQNSFGFLNSLAKAMPHEAKMLLNYLFQDNIPLEERLPIYQEKANNLLPELKKKIGKDNINHQQDERTISFLLTLHNPEKYYLYKDNVYKSLCAFLGVEPKTKAGEKYFHFRDLADSIKSEVTENAEIKKFQKIKELLNEFAFKSDNLLFQDIIYRTLIVASNNERNKELMTQIVEDVKAKLVEMEHVLMDHIWLDNDSTNYRQVSVFKNYPTYPLHYELMMHSDIAWEFHSEGNRNEKEYMELFIQGYDKSKYKLVPWKHAVEGAYKSGEFHKISPKERFKIDVKGSKYIQMIDSLSNQLIELYNDTNERLINFFQKNPSNDINIKLHQEEMINIPLNQILYGPPGTGKTYSTIDKVVELCEPSEYKQGDHNWNKGIYDQLVKDGRVVFTTFHQSMSYEDFIEGIKPMKAGDEDDFLKYDVEPGIFKQIANSSKSIKSVQNNVDNWDETTYYKMSIGGKGRPDIHNWCIENSVVGLSWGGDADLSSIVPLAQANNWIQYRDKFKEVYTKTAEENRYHIQATYIFNKMRIGDVIVISKGNHIIDAVGKVTGNYYFDDQTPTDMLHFRKVEWIATDLDASPDKFIDKQISQQSIYEFYNDDVKKETFKSLTAHTIEKPKPYVLIIDEINRGNVSAIFGELITLIEDDKRLGEPNELKITLPYSKEKFGVPSNLFILGTMNTADRSVEALDTALRRRFSFVEMLPQPALIASDGKSKETNGKIGEIDLVELLTTINDRIEVLVDRDHTIGHAYFMDVHDEASLKNAFNNKIIPLLQEYFYGNYEKMEMVIGSSFFVDLRKETVEFAIKNHSYDELPKRYKLKTIDEQFDIKTAIDNMLNKKNISTPISVNE